MLVQTSAYSIEDIFYNNYTQFMGGKITYIGYPTAHGTGNMISFSGDSGYAVSSKSPYKDAAWQFLRTFFTKDYQSENVYSLPSRLDVFDEKAEEASTVQYQKNGEGKYELDDDGEKIPIVRSSLWNSEKGEVEEIYNAYARRHQQAAQYFMEQVRLAAGPILHHEEKGAVSVEKTEDLITLSAIMGGFTRLMAEKLLLLEGKDLANGGSIALSGVPREKQL